MESRTLRKRGKQGPHVPRKSSTNGIAESQCAIAGKQGSPGEAQATDTPFDNDTATELEMQGFPVSFVKQMRLQDALEKDRGDVPEAGASLPDDAAPGPEQHANDAEEDSSTETEGLQVMPPRERAVDQDDVEELSQGSPDTMEVASGQALSKDAEGTPVSGSGKTAKRFSYKSFAPLNESDLSLIQKGKTIKGINKLPSGRYGARLYDNRLKQYKWIGAYPSPQEAFQARVTALQDSEKITHQEDAVQALEEGKTQESSEAIAPKIPRFIGVDNPHPGGKFRARYKEHYLGSFDSAEEAAEAYDLALLRAVRERGRLVHGYVTLNFPDRDYSKRLDTEPIVQIQQETFSPVTATVVEEKQQSPENEPDKPALQYKLLTSTDASGIRMVLPLPLADAIIKAYNSKGGHFAGGNDIILVHCVDDDSDEQQRTWLVSMRDYRGKHANCRGNAVFVTGWRQVVEEKQLKAGDVLEFDVRKTREASTEEKQRAPESQWIVCMGLKISRHVMPNQPRRKTKPKQSKVKAAPATPSISQKGTKRKYVSLQKLAQAAKALEDFETPPSFPVPTKTTGENLDSKSWVTVAQRLISQDDLLTNSIHLSHKDALGLLTAVPLNALEKGPEGIVIDAVEANCASSFGSRYKFVLAMDRNDPVLKGDTQLFFASQRPEVGQTVCFETDGTDLHVKVQEASTFLMALHERGSAAAQQRYTFLMSEKSIGVHAKLQIPDYIAGMMKALSTVFWGKKQEAPSVRDEWGLIHQLHMKKDLETDTWTVAEDWAAFAQKKMLKPGQRLDLVFSGAGILPEIVVQDSVPFGLSSSQSANAWEANVFSGLSPSLLGFKYEQSYQVSDPALLGGQIYGSQKMYSSRYRLKVRPINMAKGYGVTAQEDIPAGQYVFDYIGEIVSGEEAVQREANYASSRQPPFMFNITLPAPGLGLEVCKGRVYKATSSVLCTVDCTKKGNVARLVNHSCSPNLVVLPHFHGHNACPRLQVFSTKDIQAGEELLMDYHSGARSEELTQRVPCHCGSPECRGWVY